MLAGPHYVIQAGLIAMLLPPFFCVLGLHVCVNIFDLIICMFFPKNRQNNENGGGDYYRRRGPSIGNELKKVIIVNITKILNMYYVILYILYIIICTTYNMSII